MYQLDYILAHNKIYLVDKDINASAYGLSLAIEYQTAISYETRGGIALVGNNVYIQANGRTKDCQQEGCDRVGSWFAVGGMHIPRIHRVV